MTETAAPIAKPVSRPRSRKPATVSVSALAKHLDVARAYIAKLEAEGAVQGFGAMTVASAWTEKAGADHKAGTLAIPIAECMKRADALPPPPPDPNAPPPKKGPTPPPKP